MRLDHERKIFFVMPSTEEGPTVQLRTIIFIGLCYICNGNPHLSCEFFRDRDRAFYFCSLTHYI